MQIRKVVSLNIELRRLRAQKLRYGRKPGGIAILDDAEAFPRLLDRITGGLCSGTRCRQVEEGLSDFQPHARFKPFQLTIRLSFLRLRFHQAIAVRPASQKIKLHVRAGIPVRAGRPSQCGRIPL